MYSRSELEYKLKVRDARLSFRVVALSIAVIVPVWIGAYVAQRLGFREQVNAIAAPVGIVLLIGYAFAFFRILVKTGREAEVNCPKCGASLGLSVKRVMSAGVCPRCKERLVK
jgi:hypothetical protein